jgi:GNAT superfamily N-acetyltransferase
MCEVHILPHRPISDGDIAQLNALYKHLHAEFAPYSHSQIERITECGCSIIFVARVDEKIVGMVTLERDPPHEVGRYGVIRAFAVHSNHRRTGIGTALLTRALSVADQSGVTHLTLRARTDRVQARRLYKMMGFICCAHKAETFYRTQDRPIKPG